MIFNLFLIPFLHYSSIRYLQMPFLPIIILFNAWYKSMMIWPSKSILNNDILILFYWPLCPTMTYYWPYVLFSEYYYSLNVLKMTYSTCPTMFIPYLFCPDSNVNDYSMMSILLFWCQKYSVLQMQINILNVCDRLLI